MPLFEDMLSSSRGAGFIGTLLALVVLVGFGSLYLLVFDQGLQGGAKSIETMIKEQVEEIKNQKITIAHQEKTLGDSKRRSNLADEFLKTQRLIELRKKRKEEIAISMDVLKQEMERERQEWETYKEQYRVAERKRAEGEEIGDLFTKAGKTYKKVVIKTVEPLRINFRHADGNSAVTYDEAPDALVDRFQMTKEAAKVASKAENANAGMADVERSIAETKQEIEYKQSLLRDSTAEFTSKETDKEAVQERVRNLQTQISQYQSQIAAEANKSGLRRSKQYEAKVQSLRVSIANEEAKAANFARVRQDFTEAKVKREGEIKVLKDNLRKWEAHQQKIIKEMDKNAASGAVR